MNRRAIGHQFESLSLRRRSDYCAVQQTSCKSIWNAANVSDCARSQIHLRSAQSRTHGPIPLCLQPIAFIYGCATRCYVCTNMGTFCLHDQAKWDRNPVRWFCQCRNSDERCAQSDNQAEHKYSTHKFLQEGPGTRIESSRPTVN